MALGVRRFFEPSNNQKTRFAAGASPMLRADFLAGATASLLERVNPTSTTI